MSSMVPVYSIAKPFTAAATILSFDIERAIGDYLPTLPADLAGLTIKDVLAHRSGLSDYGSWPDYREAVERREDPWPDEVIIERASVGTAGNFEYSNIGYLLLRLALERFHDKDYFDVLDDLVFRPLGMRALPFAIRDNWDACDHPGVTDELRGYHPGWVYTGTFVADPDEAARGLALIMQQRLGEQVSALMMRHQPVDVPGHPMSVDGGYGLGLMLRGLPVTEVGHGGQGPGFSLFAAASADGSKWCGMVEAGDIDDLGLVRACLDSLHS